MKKLVKSSIKKIGQALLRFIALQIIRGILCLIFGREIINQLDLFCYTSFNKSFVYMLVLGIEIFKMILGL